MKDSHRKKNTLLLVLLALVCVGLVELSASYFFAPEVFARVTAPVVTAARTTVRVCQDAALAVHDSVQSFLARNSRQEADDPAIASDWDDSTATKLVTRQGRRYLTGGPFLVEYFNQSDALWAEQPYGTDNIGRYGCGPTVMAMVVSSMTETQVNPVQMAQWAVDNRCWARASGSYSSLVPQAAASVGLTAYSLTDKTPEGVKSALLSGNLMVALMGPGHFTRSGHFILLRGVTMNGNLLLADPNSTERSLLEWDPQLILDELSLNGASGGPLWVISPWQS